MSATRCRFCGADWSLFTDDGEEIEGFKLRGLYACCTEQILWWVNAKSRLSQPNKRRVLASFGMSDPQRNVGA